MVVNVRCVAILQQCIIIAAIAHFKADQSQSLKGYLIYSILWSTARASKSFYTFQTSTLIFVTRLPTLPKTSTHPKVPTINTAHNPYGTLKTHGKLPTTSLNTALEATVPSMPPTVSRSPSKIAQSHPYPQATPSQTLSTHHRSQRQSFPPQQQQSTSLPLALELYIKP
jgi:hypothetical protein